ncbi:MAG: hypothetical protein ACE5K4_02455 [Candidatus Hydrothermarchaeota archaeon]
MSYQLLALEIVHLFLGFILVFLALRGYRRTRYVPMILLAIGLEIR